MSINRIRSKRLIISCFITVVLVFAYQHLSKSTKIQSETSRQTIKEENTHIAKVQSWPVVKDNQTAHQETLSKRALQRSEYNQLPRHGSNTSQNLIIENQQPVEHTSTYQAHHHTHEHKEPRRHPEDNSLIPPGEPKKPLPNYKGEN